MDKCHPLTITGVRPPYLPAVPYFSWLYELNVRTYVYLDGVPGVWFFSLDANNALAVLGARVFFSLPYVYARIMCKSESRDVNFTSQREEAKAKFASSWTIGEDLPAAETGSLDFFLLSATAFTRRATRRSTDAGSITSRGRCRRL
jgi:uncharacterized protein YqjF (DUF2071 family)